MGAGEFPFGVTVSPDGSYAYVANQVSKTVSVINIAKNALISTVDVGNSPIGVAVPWQRFPHISDGEFPEEG